MRVCGGERVDVCVSGLVFRNSVGLHVKDAQVFMADWELHIATATTTAKNMSTISDRLSRDVQFLPFNSTKFRKKPRFHALFTYNSRLSESGAWDQNPKSIDLERKTRCPSVFT